MNDTDRVYSDRLIKLITNEIFACSAIVPSVRKPVGAAFVIKCAPRFVTKVTWAGESFGGFSIKRYLSVFVTVEFDVFYYPWSWEVRFIYDSPEFVSCNTKNAVLYTCLRVICLAWVAGRRKWEKRYPYRNPPTSDLFVLHVLVSSSSTCHAGYYFFCNIFP